LAHSYAPVVGHVLDGAGVIGSLKTVLGEDREPVLDGPDERFPRAGRVGALNALELLGERTASRVSLGVDGAEVHNAEAVWRLEHFGVAIAVPAHQDHAPIVEHSVAENHPTFGNEYSYAGPYHDAAGG